MSEIVALTINIINVKDNFVHLHSKMIDKFKTPNNSTGCMKLKVTTFIHYVSCSATPFNGNGENALNMNSELARSLNLNEFDTVIASNVEFIKSLKTVYASPVCSDDLQILNNSADLIQSLLLTQVRIIRVHQILNIWIMKSFSLKIHIDELDRELTYGKLEPYTEVIVSMNVKECQNCNVIDVDELENDTTTSNPWMFLKKILNMNKESFIKPPETIQNTGEMQFFNCGIFRCVLAKDDRLYSTHNVPYHPYIVFVSRKHFPQFSKFARRCGYCLCRLTNFPFINSTSKIKFREKEKESDSPKHLFGQNLFVHLYLMDDLTENEYFHFNSYPTIFISHSLYYSWNLKINSKVKIDLVSHENRVRLTQIDFTIIRLGIMEEENLIGEVKRLFHNYVTEKENAILNNDNLFTIHCSKDTVLHLSFNPVSLSFTELDRNDLDSWSWRLVKKRINYDIHHTENEPTIRPFSFQSQIVQHLKLNVLGRYCLSTMITYPEMKNHNHTILVGETGTGKSAVLDLLSRELYSTVFVKKLECRSLKGKLVSKLEKIFESALTECAYQQPAILQLDDLDALFASSKHNGQQQLESSVSSYSRRLSRMISETIRNYLHHQIFIIATATIISNLESCLFSPRGSALFSSILRIPVLNHKTRQECFNEILKQITQSDFENVHDFDQRTEGYCIQDIFDLVQRVHFEMLKRQTNSTSQISSSNVLRSDIGEAFTNFTPLALIGIDLHKNSSVSWKDVGGLYDAKELLTEILIWPSQYPEIFDQCPLKMQSGVLLYGAPGSGKTLLASAVAGESGLNFISIKGPELLSKFVGESEEGVRNTFKRARNAKPCILFFDEFDSLAPKRGNDITGVTDRVVNQLLTELDGVEAISGVWVLAATSRPDLIDPALLRPGRLGSLVHCPLPNESERCSILKVFCSSLSNYGNIDFKKISELTEGFTGADLRAVLYTAMTKCDNTRQMEVQSNLGVTVNADSEKTHCTSIDTNCLIEAVKETEASLKGGERQTYETICERFQRKDEKFMLPVNQKLTYA